MPVLIHYLGDEQNMEPGPHGNVKDKETAPGYQRTLPSIFEQMKIATKDRDPRKAYISYQGEARNLKQVQNIRYVIYQVKFI